VAAEEEEEVKLHVEVEKIGIHTLVVVNMGVNVVPSVLPALVLVLVLAVADTPNI
jgi:hypothetical protein